MAKITEKLKRFALIVGAVLLLILSIFGVSGGVYAAAETEGTDSAIMRELGGLTIGGAKFNAEDYPADEEGTPQLLYLSEYGYGYTADKQVAFGLVLYIYNPAQLNIVQDQRNTVQIKIGNAERYSKYALSVIEGSADKLFYKLGVSFSEEEKSAALAALDKDSRRYEVSSVEFYVEGFNATDYPISRTFTYTGYAAGLGENGESTLTNTLSYTEAGGTETIPLEVKHTSWRPEGTNGNSEYTQDSIHSVYFAVPKELDKKYDYLNSVQARWLEARLVPIYVSGNKTILNSLRSVIASNAVPSISTDDGSLTTGPDQGKLTAPNKFNFDKFDYCLEARDYTSALSISCEAILCNDWWYSKEASGSGISVKKRLNSIYLTVYTNDKSASEYVVTSSELTKMIQEEAVNGYFKNDKIVAGKYPSYLFENYDEDFTCVTIVKDEFDKNLNLHSERVEKSFWQYIFGGHTATNQQDFKSIKAIQPIEDSEVGSKTTQELSDCLYISERDAEDFRSFYNRNKNNSTVYLLRFALSEYWSATIETVGKKGTTLQPGLVGTIDRNAYFAQETCYLDFDLIDFEYVKEDKSYVIPVSMSPIDIFPELTPPPQYYDFWKYALVIGAALIVFYTVYKIVGKAIRS